MAYFPPLFSESICLGWHVFYDLIMAMMRETTCETLNPMAKWNRKKTQWKLQSQHCHMCPKTEFLFKQPLILQRSSLNHHQVNEGQMFLPCNFKKPPSIVCELQAFVSHKWGKKNLERYKVSSRWTWGASSCSWNCLGYILLCKAFTCHRKLSCCFRSQENYISTPYMCMVMKMSSKHTAQW